MWQQANSLSSNQLRGATTLDNVAEQIVREAVGPGPHGGIAFFKAQV